MKKGPKINEVIMGVGGRSPVQHEWGRGGDGAGGAGGERRF